MLNFSNCTSCEVRAYKWLVTVVGEGELGKNVVSLVFVSVLLLSVSAVFDVRMVGTGSLVTAEASPEIYFTLEARAHSEHKYSSP